MSIFSKKKVRYIDIEHCYIFECPHCEMLIQVAENEVNCQIFRHAIMKSTGQQVNPHASKEYCKSLISQNLVYGCCKPFKLFRGQNGTIEYSDKCDYI